MTIAAEMVLGLALALVTVVANTSSLPARTRWFLLLLAVFAGSLAALRRQGTL